MLSMWFCYERKEAESNEIEHVQYNHAANADLNVSHIILAMYHTVLSIETKYWRLPEEVEYT